MILNEDNKILIQFQQGGNCKPINMEYKKKLFFLKKCTSDFHCGHYFLIKRIRKIRYDSINERILFLKNKLD